MYNEAPSTQKSRIWPWLTFTLLFFAIGSCSLTAYFSLDRTFSFLESFDSHSLSIEGIGSKNVIAQLNVEGVIMGTREDLFDSLEEIEEGVKKNNIKGLMIYINSPGGSVAPTQDLFRRVLDLKTKIPVTCSMGDVAASGGYYLAAACNEIFALPGTTTGSIGVIFQFFNLENLVSWAKLKPVTIKAGKMKDVGSPFRSMTPEEQAYLENLLREVHEQFITDISKIRDKKIAIEKLREVADGRIVTGEQALKLGLVDHSGGPKDALKWLRVENKLGEELKVLRLPRPKRSFGGLLNAKKQPTEMILDQLHPFQGMVPMLLPSYFRVEK